ncbi:MAG: hypothetical protein JSV56_12985, partial [Methanomassiliicoccales archaeon]
GYDITYEDAQGDVTDSDGGQVQGYQYIDILGISSSESILGTQLLLDMTVVGVITNSDDIIYSFSIFDGGELAYYITYNNGICTGVNMDDGSTDVLQAQGTGTNTLEVRVKTSDLGDIILFDINGMTLDYNETDELYFLDSVPDTGLGPFFYNDLMGYKEMPLSIVEPKHGATVSETKTILGRTRGDYEMSFVELQFDSKSEEGWILTSTNDNWGNWSYEWDTTSLTDGKHTLNTRAFNGSEYFYDSITIYVDQKNALFPRTMGMPKIYVGDTFRYSFDVQIQGASLGIESSGTMSLQVIAINEIEVEGSTYEVFVIEVEGTQITETMGYSSSAIQKGTQWIRTSDFAGVKSQMSTTTTITKDDDVSITYYNTTTIYYPPFENYDFPVNIGEKWSKSCTIKMFIDSGSETWNETHEISSDFEALHVENVTVSAGTFETYVLWSKDILSPSTGIECTLDYFSPKLGFPVKTEYYGPNREITYEIELESYIKKEEEQDGDSQGPFGGDVPIYFLLIAIVIVVLLVLAVMAIKRRKKAAAGDLYSDDSDENQRPRVRPLSSDTSQLRHDDQRQYPPEVMETHFDRFKCPKCSHSFSVQKNAVKIQCPYCGLTER